MKRILLIVLLALNCLAPAYSQQQDVLRFSEANRAYRNRDYSGAAKIYEGILGKGLKSGALYYNLGNCYFKSGETAKAILAYERARKFLPDDEDLAYNLRLSYNNTIDKIEPVPQLFYQRWWTQILTLSSPSAWAWIAIGLLWTGVGLAAWYLYAGTIRLRKFTFLGSGAVVTLAVIFFLLAGCSWQNLNSADAAIVMNPSAEIRSSPDPKSTTLFMLHAGTKIRVMDQLGDWRQIRIANGNTGWVRAAAIETI